MDFATILGVLSGVALVFGAIFAQGGAGVFFNIPSLMIVAGGTLASTLISYPLTEVIHSFRAAGQVLLQRKLDPNEVVRVILSLANLSRRQGLVALSRVKTDNPVLRKALMLIADGAPDMMIRETLRIEINSMVQRHSVAQEVFRKMGAFAPAFGMLGTLIGLVQMLNALDNPKSIGPAMAVALITTFYGSFMSTLFFLPVSAKLKSRTKLEVINLEIIFEGALSILENNNPLLIYEKLSSFIPPKVREEYNPEKMLNADRSERD